MIRSTLRAGGTMGVLLLFATHALTLISYSQSMVTAADIIDPNAPVRAVFSGGEGILLEGPAMSPDGMLYFTDITVTDVEGMKAGIIWTYVPKPEKQRSFDLQVVGPTDWCLITTETWLRVKGRILGDEGW